MHRISQPLSESFGRFVAVGAIGFIIDAGALTALVFAVGWTLLPARIASISLAITTTWLMNRRYSFARTATAAHVEYVCYFAIQLAGVFLNVAIFMLCLRLWPHLALWPIVPQAAGSVVALSFNFIVTRRMLYAARVESSR